VSADVVLQRTRLVEALKSAHQVSPSVASEEKQMLAHMQFAAQCCTELLAQVNGCEQVQTPSNSAQSLNHSSDGPRTLHWFRS